MASRGQGVGGGSADPNSTNTLSATEMLNAARSAVGLDYESYVWTTGLLAGFRSDCSGFVSWVLSKGGVNVGDATTVTIPESSSIKPGVGSQVTLWDRPLPGQEGHVIINILGNWFESGGQLGGHISAMSTEDVQSELGVSDISSLTSGITTPNGFQPFYPVMPANSGVGSPVDSLANLWIQAGGSAGLARTMAAIAMAESNGKINAVGGPNTNGTYDYGLWQINSSHSQFNQSELTSNALYNAKAAVSIEKSSGLGAWSTYNNGAYLKFLNFASTVTPVGPGPSGGIVRPGGEAVSGDGSASDGSSGDSGASAQALFSSYDQSLQSRGSTQYVGLSGTVGSILGLPGDVAGGINDVDSFISWIAWIFHPRNLLRGVEFLSGIAIFFYGLHGSTQTSSGGGGGGFVSTAVGTFVGTTPLRKMKAASAGKKAGAAQGARDRAYADARKAARSGPNN